MSSKTIFPVLVILAAASGCAAQTGSEPSAEPGTTDATPQLAVTPDDGSQDEPDDADPSDDVHPLLADTDVADETSVESQDITEPRDLDLDLSDVSRAGGRANTDTYTKTGWRAIPDIQACVKFTFKGSVSYRAEKLDKFGGGHYWRLNGITFHAPRTETSLYQYDPGDHRCTTRPLRADKLKVSNALSGYSCSWNPQVQVSAPFGIGVGFWPSCGNRKSARYDASVSHKTNMIQVNPDTKLKFGIQVKTTEGDTPPKFNCYGSALKAKVTVGSTVATMKTPREKICLSPKW